MSAGASLIMGEHLIELDAVLGARASAHLICHGEDGVPALFDMKRLGLWRGACSAIRLRRLISELTSRRPTTLVFDKIGARERFIAGSAPLDAVPHAENIYLAYCMLLGISRPLQRPTFPFPLTAPARVGIFPGSRIAAKALPADVIGSLLDVCRQRAAYPIVHALEGEQLNLFTGVAETRRLPRRFGAVAEAIRGVDAVISADSMPAHMAEYFGRPVFVVSPVVNQYWLPLSCLAEQRWSLFAGVNTAPDALRRFLTLLERH